MNERDLELMRDYLDGTISPENLAVLNDLLESDATARKRFIAMATVEEGLADIATTVPSGQQSLPTKTARPLALLYQPIMAAAAGLIVGVFCTSAIWAATETGRDRILTLLKESFEAGPAPKVTGVPLEPGLWSGDYSEVVGKFQVVSPSDGAHMLRLLRADHLGKEPVGYSADLYHVVDLREQGVVLSDGDSVVTVESSFFSIPVADPNQFVCSITVYALSESPESSTQIEVNRFFADQWDAIQSAGENQDALSQVGVAAAQRRQAFSPESSDWRRISTDLRLPEDSRYLLIRLSVSDMKEARANIVPPAVQFEGNFADDVRVVLRQPLK